MAVNITTRELLQILEYTPAGHNIMLSGKHGIGKSRIITEYFESRGMKVVTLFLGQMSDPGDLLGLPRKDNASDRTVFMPPYWFPVDGKPVVLFLDELNRARPEILQAIMDLTLNRTLAGRSLPEGSRVISAVNEGDEYQLTDLDPALVSRFNIYNFCPTPGEWLLWAGKNGIEHSVIDFLNENPVYLDGDGRNTGEMQIFDRIPDRRSWERVSDILKKSEAGPQVLKKTVAGIIGIKAANAFFENYSVRNRIAPEAVLSDFDSCKARLQKLVPHEITILNEGIYRCIELGKQGEAASSNLMKYLHWLADGGKRECMAHFCSLFENAAYAKANMFMMTTGCFKYITDFIKTI